MPYSIRTVLSCACRSVLSGLLATGMAGVVRGEPTYKIITSENFLEINENPSGNYSVLGDIYLNQPGRSPWTPFSEDFSGDLRGNGHKVFGLFIDDSRDESNLGLFKRVVGGAIRNLIFVEPKIYSSGKGSNAGLVTGELVDGEVTGIVWIGGRIENTGSSNFNPPQVQFLVPDSGIVAFTTGSSLVQVLAINITQLGTSHSSRMAVGVGVNHDGIVQVIANNVTQSQPGNEAFTSIAVAANQRGTVQSIVSNVNQVGGNNAVISIAVTSNTAGIAQAISNNVNQAGGGTATIGIVVVSDSDATAQSVARNVNQTGGVGFDNEDGTVQEWLLTEQDKTSSLNQLGLTLLQNDWTTGNSSQYPMLVDMDGGYQDMQRLSPEFREAMQDFAPPSDDPDASWLCPAPSGKPLYQVLVGQYFYVVAYHQNSQTLSLIRYDSRGYRTFPAQLFEDVENGKGGCAYQMLLRQGLEGSTIQAGVVHHQSLYLAVNDPEMKARLLVLPLEGDQTRQLDLPAHVTQVNSLALGDGYLYYSGQTQSHPLLLARIPLSLADEDETVNNPIERTFEDEYGFSLQVTRNGTVFMVGQQGDGDSDNTLIRQFQSDLLPTSFNTDGVIQDDGLDISELGGDTGSRGKAILIHDGWVYVAGNLLADTGEDLFIRRYSLSGEVDEHYLATVTTGLGSSSPDSLDHEVLLLDSGDYLTMVKRILDDHRVFIGHYTWDEAEPVAQATTVRLPDAGTARGAALFADNQLRVAVAGNDCKLRVEQQAILLPVLAENVPTNTTANSTVNYSQADSGQAGTIAGGIIGSVAAVAAIIGAVISGGGW